MKGHHHVYPSLHRGDFTRFRPSRKRHFFIRGLNLQQLSSERARIIEPEEVAPNVVTMNSVVTYGERSHGQHQTVRLVYPRDANVSQNRISVFAPLGSALLGLAPSEGSFEFSEPRAIGGSNASR